SVKGRREKTERSFLPFLPLLPVVIAACAAPVLRAQTRDHTLIVLSHSNHTVYELDAASGTVVHEFVAPDQPHEAAITRDGATVFASVPAASVVDILDGAPRQAKR